MEKQDKGNNRYTNAASSEDRINEINKDDIILKILKDEFPDDEHFQNGQLTAPSAASQAFPVMNFISVSSLLIDKILTVELPKTIITNKHIPR